MQKRIAVDLTPILPGGTNGGAKIMTLQLIKHLSQLAPDATFILLASKHNYSELSKMKSANIDVICASSSIKSSSLFSICLRALLFLTGKLSSTILPDAIKIRLAYINQRIYYRSLSRNLSHVIQADLLFCPFTAPLYRDLDIPIVSVIYDLQSYYYPYFFSATENYCRKKNFQDACYTANKLICISDFVKETILEKSSVAAEDIKTIHIRLAHRLPTIQSDDLLATLNRYQLKEQHYLFFPANFWSHKNHAMLFTAFGMYRAANPTSTLKLVCTGADDPQKALLLTSIQDMGLSTSIIMPGYVSDLEFASLLMGCRAVIFPSLYEGFGMPILEAMAAGKPVLCSNSTSLPEVAGNAAIFFDPRKPDQIVEAIQSIEQNLESHAELIKLGYKRVAAFGTELDMAKEYLNVFNDVSQTAGSILK